jgi:hypothetical protein
MGGSKDFSLLQSVQTGSGATESIIRSIGPGGFPRGQAVMKLITHLHLAARLRVVSRRQICFYVLRIM